MNYKNGKLCHITRMFDRGIITLSLDDYNNLTHFQQLALVIITDEIIQFRSNKNTFLTY
ncbi:MAG: hypothetical protein J6W71_01070 [Methanobrevibacter sp.]|nr:hypothetical protein [Methanobrevibacter sp.]